MATRTKRTVQNVKTREKIQATQLVNRLQGHVNGKYEMSTTQIRAAEILLRKSLPDLQAVEMTGADGKDLAMPVLKIIHE